MIEQTTTHNQAKHIFETWYLATSDDVGLTKDEQDNFIDAIETALDNVRASTKTEDAAIARKHNDGDVFEIITEMIAKEIEASQ